MKKAKHIQKTLLLSILSLLLYFAMWMGTTLAWFTDEVNSGRNVIAAGNLDIELEYERQDGSWATVNGATDLFTGNLWEPGHTEIVNLRLTNKGTLHLKYQLCVQVTSETPGTNTAGEPIRLSDHIEYGVVAYNAEYTRDTARAAVTVGTKLANGYEAKDILLAPGQITEMTLVIYMPETVDNEANYRGTDIPTIDLGIHLQATQAEAEGDSFGKDYDDEAAYGVMTYGDLVSALAEGGRVVLGADILVTEEQVAWNYSDGAAAHLYIPNDVEVTLDLNGHSLTNVGVSSSTRYDVIANYGTLTVTDSLGGGIIISDNGSADIATSRGFAIRSYGDLNLQDVVIDGNTGSYTVYIEGAGNTLTVDNATVSGRGALAVYNGAHGVVNSGDFSIDVLTANSRDNVLALYNATAEVHGGNFDGTLKTLGSNDDGFAWKGSSCVMLMENSTAYVYGGTFAAREADLFSHGSKSAIYAYGGSFHTVNVLGDSALHEHHSTSIVEVYGGTFVYDPSDYLAAGYQVIKTNEFYTVCAQMIAE